MRLLLFILCLVPIGVLLPVLEVGPTHVFNPEWPGHARLHEVWQLLSNCALMLLCLWLAWRERRMALACTLVLIQAVGFLAAFGMSSLYGGTMRHSDGTELAVGGVNVAVLVMLAVTAILLGLLVDSLMRGSDPARKRD